MTIKTLQTTRKQSEVKESTLDFGVFLAVRVDEKVKCQETKRPINNLSFYQNETVKNYLHNKVSPGSRQ